MRLNIISFLALLMLAIFSSVKCTNSGANLYDLGDTINYDSDTTFYMSRSSVGASISIEYDDINYTYVVSDSIVIGIVVFDTTYSHSNLKIGNILKEYDHDSSLIYGEYGMGLVLPLDDGWNAVFTADGEKKLSFFMKR